MAMQRLTSSVTEVAELLGISRSKAYELVAEGTIPVVPLSGRRRLVARKDIDDLLNGRPIVQPQRPAAGQEAGPVFATPDPPAHSLHRSAVFSELVAKRMAELEPDVIDIAHGGPEA